MNTEVQTSKLLMEIIDLHDHIEELMHASIAKAIEIGGKLIQKRELLSAAGPGGDTTKQFEQWIQKQLPFTPRQAYKYITVYKGKDLIAEKKPDTLTGALKLLSPPKKSGGLPEGKDSATEENSNTEEPYTEPSSVDEKIHKSTDNVQKHPENSDSLHPMPPELGKIGDGSRFWWETEILGAIGQLNRTYKTLVRERTKDTPKDLAFMIGNLKDFSVRLESWLPQNLIRCERCEGTSAINKAACSYCYNGKTGKAKESTY